MCPAHTCPSFATEPARDFIRAALNKDASKRPTMHQLLRHNWLRAYQVGGQEDVADFDCQGISPLLSKLPPEMTSNHQRSTINGCALQTTQQLSSLLSPSHRPARSAPSP